MPRAQSNTHPDSHSTAHRRQPASRLSRHPGDAGFMTTFAAPCGLARHRDALLCTRAPWRRRVLAMTPLLVAIGLSLLVTG